MQAIVIPEYGDPDVLTLMDVPDPAAGPEDLLVGVRATALNRADLLQRRGLYPQPGRKPEFEIPGLEFAGDVIAVGERVEGFEPGDRVMGLLPGGGYAEKVVLNSRLASPIPADMSYTDAASVPEAFITAHDALVQCGTVSGESVLIHAAGSGVGAAAIQVARVMGAGLIIGTAGSADKLARAAALGLDAGVNYREEDVAARVAELTGRRGVDVALDFVGAAYLDTNLRALAEKGRMIVIGVMGGASAECNLGLVLMKRLQIRGTLLRARSLEEKATAIRAFEKSVLGHMTKVGDADARIRPVVDSVVPFAEASAAHERMEANANFGKIVLEL